MSLYLTDKAKPIRARSLFALMAANIGFAVSVLWAWTFLYVVLGEPIVWATSRTIGAVPDIFEYPYLMLWLLPILAVLVARLLGEAGSSRGAYTAVIVPPAVLAMVFALYHILPR